MVGVVGSKYQDTRCPYADTNQERDQDSEDVTNAISKGSNVKPSDRLATHTSRVKSLGDLVGGIGRSGLSHHAHSAKCHHTSALAEVIADH